MSLFGAMTSGVSGLAAQSSAMGTIADNITNVNTVGYKGSRVDFQTLVTKQASQTQYAAGGVQARPRGGVDIQGLLQSSVSETDLAISGDGFFLVNESNQPGQNDQYLFSRAGSFQTDNQGYLRNTGGYYLQGWPTDAAGNVILPGTSTAAVANQNVISTEYLETINLNRVSGTATATTRIGIGANLPATAQPGQSHSVDVQFFDTLGNPSAANFQFTKTAANEWGLIVEPPAGTAVATLRDAAGNVYASSGQIEFLTTPASGDVLVIGGTSIVFGDGTGGTININQPLSAIVADVVAAADAIAGVSARAKSTSANALVIGGDGGAVAVDPSGLTSGTARQVSAFTVASQPASPPPAITFGPNGVPAAFAVATMDLLGFANGAGDMDGSVSPAVQLNFGTPGLADGLTQFGADFTPTYIEQDGARFGVFSGVSVGSDGVVYALFDNGERRAIYRIPLVTFANPNALQAVTGNAWAVTEGSGNPTLREAASGSAGKIVQTALEASTVDIGEEFTRMIVVQRAYSAATRIISTADDMLEELVRIKR